jgi:hypothetical protein
MTTARPPEDCRCLTPPIDYRDYDRTGIGIDETAGRFAEVSVERCVHCDRLWLRYFIESEGHSQTGRWYRGVVTAGQAQAVTPEAALDVLAGLPWLLYGGSYYATT